MNINFFRTLTVLSLSLICINSAFAEEDNWGVELGIDVASTKFEKSYTRPSAHVSADRKFFRALTLGAGLFYRTNGPQNLNNYGLASYFRYKPFKRVGVFAEIGGGWSFYKVSWAAQLLASDYKSTGSNGHYGARLGWIWRVERNNFELGPSLGWSHHPRTNLKDKLGGNTIYVDSHNNFSLALLLRKTF